MDILAHAMWAAAGAAILRRKVNISEKSLYGIVLLAVLPDVLPLIPLFGWVAVGDGSIQAVPGYLLAAPGTEPVLPPIVQYLTHHLHCTTHSAIVAGGVSLLLSIFNRQWCIPLLGWWSHIIIDVFSHSNDYYPAPVLYPITYRGFDGIAWNGTTFMLLNYLVLGALCIWLLRTRNRNAPQASVPSDKS